MDFIFGFIGALLAIALFAGGVFCGWRLKVADQKRERVITAQELNEKERQMLKEQQEAFNRLQNYTVEDAYGLNRQDTPGEQFKK